MTQHTGTTGHRKGEELLGELGCGLGAKHGCWELLLLGWVSSSRAGCCLLCTGLELKASSLFQRPALATCGLDPTVELMGIVASGTGGHQWRPMGHSSSEPQSWCGRREEP